MIGNIIDDKEVQDKSDMSVMTCCGQYFSGRSCSADSGCRESDKKRAESILQAVLSMIKKKRLWKL